MELGLVLLIGFGLWNPLNIYLGLAGALIIVLAPLAVTIPAVALQASLRSRVARLCLGVAGAVLAVLVAGISVVWMMLLALGGPFAVKEQVVAVQGQYQLVRVGPHPHRPGYRIELRRAFGPLSQRTVVWLGPPMSTGRPAAWFAGPREVAVSTPTPPCVHHSAFSSLTLTPDPAHEEPYDRC